MWQTHCEYIISSWMCFFCVYSLCVCVWNITFLLWYPLVRYAMCKCVWDTHTASRRIHSAVTGVYPAIFNFLRLTKPHTKIHHILRPTHRPFKTYIETDKSSRSLQVRLMSPSSCYRNGAQATSSSSSYIFIVNYV